MNKRGGKKGQFFIIAALVLSVMIFSFAAVTNYVLTRPEPAQFFDLADELGVESANIISHGVATDKDVGKLIESFSDEYSEYAGKDTTLILVYGNKTEITIISYAPASTGSITLELGGTITQTITTSKKEKNIISPTGNTVVVKVGDKEYSFEIKEGENFYFVLSQQAQGGTYVSQG